MVLRQDTTKSYLLPNGQGAVKDEGTKDGEHMPQQPSCHSLLQSLRNLLPLLNAIISQLKSHSCLKPPELCTSSNSVKKREEKKKELLVLSCIRAICDVQVSCLAHTAVSHCSIAFRENREQIILSGEPEAKRVKSDKW